MTLPVTSFFAGMIGLLMMLLAARVILRRREISVGFGTGDDEELTCRVRALGNCAETAPIALILLALLELQAGSNWWAIVLGTLLIAGRSIHGWAFSYAGAPLRWRVFGMALTLVAIGCLSISVLAASIFI